MDQRTKEEILQDLPENKKGTIYYDRAVEHLKIELLTDIRDNLKELTNILSTDIQWNTDALNNLLRTRR